MDRFTRGFLAGIIAAAIQFVIAYILYYFNFTEMLWQSFASVMIYGRRPLLFGERIFAEMGVWFFSGLMGVLFVYLIKAIDSNNFILKGFVFAETIWFGTFAITLLYKVPEFDIITFKTSVSNFILAAVWGIALSLILRVFDRKTVDTGS